MSFLFFRFPVLNMKYLVCPLTDTFCTYYRGSLQSQMGWTTQNKIMPNRKQQLEPCQVHVRIAAALLTQIIVGHKAENG